MMYAEIQGNISSGSLTRILRDCLCIRKHARWEHNNWSVDQKRGRVDRCTSMLRKFDSGRSPHIWGIATEVPTWTIYQSDPEMKQHSMGLPRGEPTCEIQKTSASKQMIARVFAKSGHAAIGTPTTVCLKSSNGWVSMVC